MRRFALAVFLLAACASQPNAPAAALKAEELPPQLVQVKGEEVLVWGYGDTTEEAEALAHAELAKFASVAVQQLDLQLQFVGQESATAEEAKVIVQKVSALDLGRAEQASGEHRVVRYKLGRSRVEDAVIAGVPSRPLKESVVRAAIMSFDASGAANRQAETKRRD